MNFSIKEALSFGWNTLKQQFLFIISLYILLIATAGVMGALQGVLVPEGSIGEMFFGIAIWLIQSLILLGVVHIFLKLHDGQTVSYSDLSVKWQLLPQYIGVSLLYGLIVAIGFILLIIPGIFFALKYMFAYLIVIDKGIGPIEALKKSGSITKGHTWQLLGFVLILLLINILGFMALFIGQLVTMPLTALAVIYVYKKLLNASLPVVQAESSVISTSQPSHEASAGEAPQSQIL